MRRLAILLLTACATVHATDPRVAFEELTRAGVKRDVGVLDQLYARDYFHTNPDGSVMKRDAVLESYRAVPSIVVDSATHDDEVWQINRDVAVVSTNVTTHGMIGALPFARHFRVTYVFAFRRHRWLVLTSHATALR